MFLTFQLSITLLETNILKLIKVTKFINPANEIDSTMDSDLSINKIYSKTACKIDFILHLSSFLVAGSLISVD